VLAENVAGHITMGLDEVLSDLEGQGYSARPFVIPACAIGAPHRRDRVWIVAYSNDKRERHELRKVQETHGEVRQRHNNAKLGDTGIHEGRGRADDGAEDVADTKSKDNSQQTRKINATGSNVSGRQTEVWLKSRRRGEDVADTDDTRQQQSDKEVARKLSKQFNSSGFQSRKNKHDSNPSGEQLQRGSKKPFYGKPNVPGEFGRMGKNVKGRQAFISKLGGSLDGVSAWLDGSWEDGIPRVSESEKGRAERLKGLGNAVVPQIVEQIGRAIIEAENGI